MKSDRINLILFLLGVGLLLCLVAPVWATEVNQSNDMNNQTTGNVTNKGSFALGAGDVDIAQCYRSWSVILYQDSKPNLLCVADSLDAKGLYVAAARTRCSVKAYAKVFESVDECIELSTVEPYVEPVAMPEPEDDDEDYHEEQQQAYAQDMAELESRLGAVESRRQTTKVTREVIPFLSEEKRAKLKAILDES